MAKARKETKKLLEEARERYPKTISIDKSNRDAAKKDIRFIHVPGEQWDDVVKKERGNERPMYEFNTLRITCKRIINDIRANRAQGKARPTEEDDVDTADVMEGLIRNIWSVSDGDAAVDTAADFQVTGGYGAWRVRTKYADDSAWEQDIEIAPLANPFCLSKDPASIDPLGRDARYWFLTTTMRKEIYEQKYGDIPPVEFETEDDENGLSVSEDQDSVRIAEYWYQKPVTRQLALLKDGRTVDLAEYAAPPELISQQRTVRTNQICMAILSGDKVLEGPTEWAGKYFPFIPVYGEYIFVDGKIVWYGAVRHAKDPQRLHNYMMTSAAESAALHPTAHYWATPEQADGNTAQWSEAHKKNYPFLIHNNDAKRPGAVPQRMPGGDVPAAFIGLAQVTQDEVKATTGIFDASLGNRSNETAGVAIRQRQAEGQIATFNFGDNIAKGIRRTWEILVDLVPRIYDTERSVRILGADGAEEYVRINQRDPATGKVINDLSRGKYDVQITVGPNFGTKRQEAAEVYMGLSQGNPQVMGVAGDLIFKSLDLPYADEMAERFKVLLPPPVQQMLQAKEQNGGKVIPPEAQAAMQQAAQAMQMVEQQSQLVQAAAAEVDSGKAEAEKAAADLQVQAAKLNADYQRMMADITRKEADLKLKEAQLLVKAATDEANVGGERQELEAERQDVAAMVAQSTAEMQANVQAFMEAAAQAIVQIQATTAEAAASVAPRPQAFKFVRDADGSLVGRSDSKEVRVKRSQGGFDSTVTPLQ